MSDEQNPYALSPDKIAEPPTTILGSLKYIGPGFIISASIVGSGELIATTILGAKAGFVAFWIIILSCLVKVTLQLEFGKHAIQSGETTMRSFNQLGGPRLRGVNWSVWSWLLIMTLKFLQVGGIVGGVAIILHMVVPLPLPDLWPDKATSDEYWLPPESLAIWAVIVAICVALLVFRGYYLLIEKLSLIMIGLFTLFTIASVIALQSTEFSFSFGDIVSGLQFKLPADQAILFAAIGAFGITGIGGDEIMMYNYWLLEKGYAAKTGKRDDSPEWNRRAKGWIRVMYLDAILSMIVYTVVTAAFYILGAAVLHSQGLVPEDSELVNTLSRMYTDTLGPWARNAFLIGAFVVLFSTLFAALAGWTRLFSDCFAQFGWYDFGSRQSRLRSIGWLAWIIPFLWALVFILFQKPGWMVLVGGIGTSIILLIVVVAAFQFRYRHLPDSLKPGKVYDFFLWLSATVIIAAGIYALLQNAGIF